MSDKPLTPVGIAVALALAVVSFIVFGACAVALSVLLSLNAVHKAETSQRAGAVHECQALKALDDARTSVGFPNASKDHPSELYLSRLQRDIHNVYEASGCTVLLGK